MTPEAERTLEKARRCLANARAILAIGIGEDAGRGAYLAGFHAAQAYIFETAGKVARTHNGVQALFVQLARNDQRLPPELLPFLSQAYHLKAVADYETGEGASVPLDRAAEAIETAARLIACVAAILEDRSPSPGAANDRD